MYRLKIVSYRKLQEDGWRVSLLRFNPESCLRTENYAQLKDLS
ncbi:hypothetical protein HanPSC8_Chr15g0654871 [Helianthus annuus]|nr:hypothetical protein HanPSC8_Chr15g0654871 [Helianthus annuus]